MIDITQARSQRAADLFFFKQKTAYEIRLSLVGSEMCIKERKWEPAPATDCNDNFRYWDVGVCGLALVECFA